MGALTLSSEVTDQVEELVTSGRYRSADDVVRHGLALVAERDRDASKLDALRAAIAEGLESGPAEPLDMAEIRREALDAFSRR